MILYTVRRLLYTIVILGMLTLAIFGITQVLPGNVANMILGSYQNPESIAAVSSRLGLDAPWYEQYWRWLVNFLHGDMGTSLSNGRPVSGQIREAGAASLALALPSLVLGGVLGILTGVLGAVTKERWPDNVSALLSYIGVSVPEFVWGLLLIVIFAGGLHLLPSGGTGGAPAYSLSAFKYLILPVATLAITLFAHIARQARSSVLETLQSNYVRSAKSRGLSQTRILVRHALRNAMLPIITVLALDVSYLVGGIVVVESVFGFPGIGRLTLYAIERRDLPLMQACILLSSAVFIVGILISDLLYAFLDPRIRYGKTNR